MHSWDSDGLWKKAKLFMDRASEHDQASPEFAFYASLAVECLGRSALTKINPVLNADPRDENNIFYGCGFPFAKPRSLPAHSVFLRLEKLIDDFQKSHRELCEFLALQRNAHVHTADLPYEGLVIGKWLPRFYDTIDVLHKHLGIPMKKFIGEDGVDIAKELVKTLNDEVISSVKSKVSAHHKVFEAKEDEEKKKLFDAALINSIIVLSDQDACHCPACGAEALINGKKFKQHDEQYVDGELTADIEYLSTAFQCVACGLTLSSIEEIAHAGLPTHFKKTEATELHVLYEHDYEQEYDNM